MSPGPHFQTIPQSLNGEHSFVDAPVSLYNLTKSAPDPLFFMRKKSLTYLPAKVIALQRFGHSLSDSIESLRGRPFMRTVFLKRTMFVCGWVGGFRPSGCSFGKSEKIHTP